jgi:hypothetical protein
MYRVWRDTREKLGWSFPRSSGCDGTSDRTLKTGDYTIEGMEDRFTIERKGTVGELAQNLFQDRFRRELDRMEQCEHAYLVLEFSVADVMTFPVNSGIPPSRWRFLKVTPQLLLRRLQEVQIAHPRLHVAGDHGREYAQGLFRRMAEIRAAA